MGEKADLLHFRTLGTLDLAAPSGEGADELLTQSRGAALLIYLLLARPRGYVRRDRVCAMFWPEADEEHARGALSQTLTRIRRAAGEKILELRGRNELRVAPGAIECDVLEFEAALAAGDHGRALELYAGPFLSGFHLPDSPEFDQWLALERNRLQTLAAEAGRTLTHEHIAAGRLPEAGRAATRALSLAPESEALAAELVSALAAAGDRAGALHLYEAWSDTLRRELEIEPSGELRSLADHLYAFGSGSRGTGGAGAGHQVAEASAAAPTPSPPDWSQGTGEPSDPEAAALTPPAARRRWRFGLRHAVTTTGLAAVLVGGWGLARPILLRAGYPVEASGRAGSGFQRHDWLVVADFESRPADAELALAFETLLVRDIESSGYAGVAGGSGGFSQRPLDDVLSRMRLPPDTRIDPDIACEIAERDGAAGVLAGRVVPLGTQYVLAATVLDRQCHEMISASAVADSSKLSAAVTAVARELRARLGESRATIRSSPPLPPMAAGNIAAVRAAARYLASPTLWTDEAAGRLVLSDAIRADPDFAFAHYLLALHEQRAGNEAAAVPHILRSYEVRARLPRAGRLGMEGIYRRFIASDLAAARATAETLIGDTPQGSFVTEPFLAELELWSGKWERALDVSLRYLAGSPTPFGAYAAFSSASAAAWALGRVPLADSMSRGALLVLRRGGAPPFPAAALLQYLRHRDWSGAETYCAAQRSWDRCGHFYLARGKLSAAATILAPAAADTSPGSFWSRAAATAALAEIEQLRGRPESAARLLLGADRSMPATGPARAGSHLKRFILCASAAGLERGGSFPECAVEREDIRAWDADPSFNVLLRSGAWSRRLLAVRSLARGDAAAAVEQGREAVRVNFGNAGSVDHLIAARAFDALGQRDSALARYTAAAAIERDCCFPTAAAILFPLAPVYRRIGELAEESGDTAVALRFYGEFTRLWSEADAPLQPQVRAVADRIRRLRRNTPVPGS